MGGNQILEVPPGIKELSRLRFLYLVIDYCNNEDVVGHVTNVRKLSKVVINMEAKSGFGLNWCKLLLARKANKITNFETY